MVQIFISYKHQEKTSTFVKRLVGFIRAWGYKTWLDVEDIPPGANWDDTVDEDLRASDVVVGVITPEALDPKTGRNVLDEWDAALRYKRHFIPLLLREVDHIPTRYGRIQYIDFTKNEAQGLEQLKNALLSLSEPSSSNTDAYTDQHSRAPIQPRTNQLTLENEDYYQTRLELEIKQADELRTKPASDPYFDYLRKSLKRVNRYLLQMYNFVSAKNHRMPISLQFDKVHAGLDTNPAFAIENNPREFQSVAEAIRYFDGKLVLLGEQGSGKTTALLEYAREVILRRLHDPTEPLLPVFAPIYTWRNGTFASCEDWLIALPDSPADISQLIHDGQALLMLDGLEDIRDQDFEGQRSYQSCLQFLQALPKNNPILLTCRKGDFACLLEDAQQIFVSFGIITQMPVTKEQAITYLEGESQALSFIQENRSLIDWFRRPRVLNAFVDAYYDVKNSRKQPAENALTNMELLNQIFDIYVNKEFERERKKVVQNPQNGLPYTHHRMCHILGIIATKKIALSRGDGEDYTTIEDSWEAAHNPHPEVFAKLACDLNLLQFRKNHYNQDTLIFAHNLLRDHFALTYLQSNFRSLDESITRSDAIKALGEIRQPIAISLLIPCLHDSYSDEAFRALKNFGEALVQPLVTEFDDLSWQLKLEVTKLLGTVRNEVAFSHLMSLRFAYDDRSWRNFDLEPQEHDQWREKLQSEASRSLVRYGSAAVVPLLKKLTVEARWSNDKIAAADVLGRIKDPMAVDALISLLADKDTLVRAAAATALGDIADAKAVIPLTRVLEKKDAEQVLLAAIWALGELMDAGAVQSLLFILEIRNSKLQTSAILALGKIGDAAAANTLLDLFSESVDEELRIVILIALAEIGDYRFVDVMLQVLEGIDDKKHSGLYTCIFFELNAIEKLDDGRVINSLIRLLGVVDITLRRRVFDKLEVLLERRPLEPVDISLLADIAERSELRLFTCSLLAQIGGEEAIDCLCSAFEEAELDERGPIAFGIGTAVDDATIGRIEPFLEDDTPSYLGEPVCCYAIRGLRENQSISAIEKVAEWEKKHNATDCPDYSAIVGSA